MPLPRSTIPVGPSGLTLSTCTVLSPLFRRRRHPRCLFRNSITRLRHPLSTLQVVRYRTRMQDSLPAGGWPLPGGCRTLWIPTKSFYHLHLISSFSGFILARRNVSQVAQAQCALQLNGYKIRGGPVGLAVDSHGDLPIADDTGNSVWRVSAASRRGPFALEAICCLRAGTQPLPCAKQGRCRAPELPTARTLVLPVGGRRHPEQHGPVPGRRPGRRTPVPGLVGGIPGGDLLQSPVRGDCQFIEVAGDEQREIADKSKYRR
jgi:hypothetical protein